MKVGLRLALRGMRFGGQDLGRGGGGPECWLVGLKECGTMGTYSDPQVPQPPEANRLPPGLPVPQLLTCGAPPPLTPALTAGPAEVGLPVCAVLPVAQSGRH